MKKIALITGITGQDGAYLAKLLVEKDYCVYGLMQRSTRYPFTNLDYLGITNEIEYIEGNMLDEISLINVMQRVHPNEIYNLAAQSFVKLSWDQPIVTSEIDGIGVLRLLEAMKNFAPTAKFYQASTSEMFGNSHQNGFQTEDTAFHPCSPYAVAKLYGYWIVNCYRRSYNMFCVNGILFNHESPVRGKEFVTRKITYNVARIKLGLLDHFGLGNLDSSRDWGYSGDYVRAMYLMLQQDNPDDYIIATGKTHSIREFLDVAFNHVGISDWKDHIYVDPRFKRPVELQALRGDYSKTQRKLGWYPKVNFKELVCMMVDADLSRLQSSLKLKEE